MSFSITATQKSYPQIASAKRKSIITRFFQWAEGEDKKHHIGWVGVSITSMSAVFFPLTMAAVLVQGASFSLIMAAMVSLALVVITNLAALSTKYTIPFFFLGILIDAGIVVAAMVNSQ